MNIDVIIGNPPYQLNTASIYQYFIEEAINLNSEHIVMIVKNNWLMSDTLKDTRNRMIETGLVKVINYPVVGELFTSIRVGVNIFYLKNKYKGETEFIEMQNGVVMQKYYKDISELPLLLTNRIELNIVHKILKDLKNGNFGVYSLPTEPFRITSILTVGRGESAYKIEHRETEDIHFNIKVACMNEKELEYKYIKYKDVPARQEMINQYKIISGSRFNTTKNVISNIHLIDKGSVCTGSWAILFSSDSIEHTENALKYIKTKFFRFLVLLMCDSGMTTISTHRFSLVPIQDLSCTWTDDKLYKKYNFTEEEINYIESKIKSID